MKRKEHFQLLPKELHQLKYEAISVPQGSVRLVKKDARKKKFNLLFVDPQSSDLCFVFKAASAEKIRFNIDSVAIEVSSRPKLTGILREKAFLHVLRRRLIGCPDSRKRTR
ncbi:hypothetical protein TNCV_3674491 [Trichonephila clavipes]|nr:hypothetical protein TNCV_3674491 [Trichonephila clavipes]